MNLPTREEILAADVPQLEAWAHEHLGFGDSDRPLQCPWCGGEEYSISEGVYHCSDMGSGPGCGRDFALRDMPPHPFARSWDAAMKVRDVVRGWPPRRQVRFLDRLPCPGGPFLFVEPADVCRAALLALSPQ